MTSSQVTRRHVLVSTRDIWLLAAAAQLMTPIRFAGPAFASDEAAPVPTPAERGKMADLASAFTQKYEVPALSVAIGTAGTIAYQDAFGLADEERHQSLRPENRFRIASVTKPLTSAAIFSLVEKERLRLSDKVFGPGAILGTRFGPTSPEARTITVEHLLTHTCGGWSNSAADPMFSNPGFNHARLIEWTLATRPLDHIPGENYAYSNFGYCVLGRVIEAISGKPYAQYVADAILKPCGIGDMAIAGNGLSERQANEVKYYGQGENPYNMNVARMDS